MNSSQDDSDPTNKINKIRESKDFQNPHRKSEKSIIGADSDREINVEENVSLGSNIPIDEKHSREKKHTSHRIFVRTAWVGWVAAVLVLVVFLWNYLMPDCITWLNPERISDLKFLIGVTAINVAGLYIQWLKSNKEK